MQQGRESQTAVMVCMARAAAHGTTNEVPRFSDPTAVALLPEDARRRIERLHAGAPPANMRERIDRAMIAKRGKMMVARTVAIDDAVRARVPEQLVILGAGLDGRAWRMSELHDTTVFEVDHPDSQREKRARAAALSMSAREVRFVPVDFTRDDLDSALSAAGHDPTKPTTWIWEGVVMYLERAAIEATLRVISDRSASGSRLIVVYHRPALKLRLIGLVLRRIGEPLRSAFTPEQMSDLLARYGFTVVADDDLPTIAGKLAPQLARDARMLNHLRVATADRAHFSKQ